jgi:hypothetical protein
MPLSVISGAMTQTFYAWRDEKQEPKLPGEVPTALRQYNYSIHTERSYVEWIVRFTRFRGIRSHEETFP